MAELVPNYLDIDFTTFKTRIQEQLEETLSFNNYNYAGSNITVLIELMAYLSELSTYYLNKIAKNVYIDSADIYENVSRLAQFIGYYPKGYLSSEGEITLTIKNNVPNNSTIRIYPWTQIWTYPPTDEDAYVSGTEAIYFTVPVAQILEYPDDFTYNANTGYYDYSGIEVKQGTVKTYSYTGNDLVDGVLYLPNLNFDYDQNLDDTIPSVEVSVNDTVWTRINDFYSDITSVTDDDNVYRLVFNKYQQYVIEFSDTRAVPSNTDRIDITLLETIGDDGNVGVGWITKADSTFLTVITSGGSSYYLSTDDFNITNESSTLGGDDAEALTTIKNQAKSFAQSQYRCVTKNDYVNYLLEHATIADANVWGEQEQNPITNGNPADYNKVYVSIVPVDPWDDKLNYFTDENGMRIASSYSTEFLEEVAQYLEPRKMLCAYEEFILPDFIYFKFTISIRVRSNYRFVEVSNALKNKIEFYFAPENRSFGEKFSFNDMVEFILDMTKSSTTDAFSNVAGIININIRDIAIYDKVTQEWTDPYAAGSDFYPQYISYDTSYWDENTLRVIQLGYNQFPYIKIADSVILEEVY